MSNLPLDSSDNIFQSLAMRMRPGSLAQYISQQHLLAVGKSLPRTIEVGHLYPVILWGPPGIGKVTLAEVIAHYTSIDVGRISAITSGVEEIREAIERARQNRNTGRRTILFVDEVHRFNKSQRDVFLPHVEDGTVTFVGATAKSPSSELNSALLSRARVYLLKSLGTGDIGRVLTQVMEDETHGYGGQDTVLPDEARRAITELVNGDARRALNTLEMMADMTGVDDSGKRILRLELLTEVIGECSARLNSRGDHLYDLIFVLHRSVRGSASDATLYWYTRVITAGGDPLYVACRCLAIASEGAGNADPQAMQVAITAWSCFTRVGPVEGERAIVQAIVYLTCAPKSNAIYITFKITLADACGRPGCDMPIHLCNAPTKLMREVGYGQEYRCVHDEASAYTADEAYFPPEMTRTCYYFSTNRGLEGKIGEELVWPAEQGQNNPIECYHQCHHYGNVVNVSL